MTAEMTAGMTARWGALAGVGVVLLAITAVSRRPLPTPPPTPLPDRNTYRAIWQRQHNAGDVDPAKGFVGWFVDLSYTLGSPLARVGLQPDVLTLWGLWLAAAVAVAAAQGNRWCLLAAPLVAVSALTDGVDGCVAGLTGRATRRGFVLDSVVDRLSDGLFAGALVLAGGAPWSGVAAAGALMMLEYLRSRAGNAGLGEVGVVTVGERPSRTVAAVLGLLAMGIAPDHAPFIGTGSLLIMLALAVVGFVQLSTHVARRMG